ncbi:hypothetical protein AALP_AA6G186300 [Arabis alpina]|uniref:Uncharacterized protein n=1 Tax=Arabis alpina TaxID=50452 RepID=A0A087GQ41_ARAAL|nr:hypothetical protein AALP_AA6G186300 [Arabis alpina]
MGLVRDVNSDDRPHLVPDETSGPKTMPSEFHVPMTQREDTKVLASGIRCPEVVNVPMCAEGPTGIDGVADFDRTENLGNQVEDTRDVFHYEDPGLPLGNADAPLSLPSFSSFGSQASSVRGSTDEEGCAKAKGEEEILLVVLASADRDDSLPPGTLLCSRTISTSACFGFRYPECGVDISIEHLSSLLDFRVRGRSEEVKHSVTNALNMTLIAGFPNKDDHFEDRFFFFEISEKTVEADCIGIVKTRWERRAFPSAEFVTAMRDELSSGNGDWKRSFSRKRIKRALFAEIIWGRFSAAAKAAGSSVRTTSVPTTTLVRARSSMISAPKTPATSTLRPFPSLTPDELVMRHMLSEKRALHSSGKEKGIDRGTPTKMESVDTYPAAIVEREASASCVVAPPVSGLLRDEAYAATKFKALVTVINFF